MSKGAIEIPGDWTGRDKRLHALAQKTGFQTVNRLLTHLAYEASHCKDPATFYRACAQFAEHAQRKKTSR